MKEDSIVPLMIRLPGMLHVELKAVASAEERSLNWMVVALLRDGLKARGSAAGADASRPLADPAQAMDRDITRPVR